MDEDSVTEVPAGVSGGDARSDPLALSRGDCELIGVWVSWGVAVGDVSLEGI